MFHDPPEPAQDTYLVVYQGGHPDVPAPDAGEMVLTENGLRFVPASGITSFWQPTVWVAYHKVSHVAIEDHNIRITYVTPTGATELVRFEMVSGATLPDRAAKCREFEDRLRTLTALDWVRIARSAACRAQTVWRAVIRVRRNDDWHPVAVIDGRDYPDWAEYRRVLDEAFETLDDYEIPAEVETHPVDPEEPPFRLPSWAEYRSTLGDRQDGA